VDLQQVARGLWRWTEPHPEWEEPTEDDSPADWPRDVGCVAYEVDDTLVLIDPLVTDDCGPLDELAERSERVAILRTLPFHERSRAQLAERYGTTDETPAGVDRIEVSRAGETIYWLPEHGALVPGDRILGDRPPGLRVSPQSWLRYLDGYTRDDLRHDLRPLLELPVEMVLVSHGEPVYDNAHGELERALA
jgi:hypothetical protein